MPADVRRRRRRRRPRRRGDGPAAGGRGPVGGCAGTQPLRPAPGRRDAGSGRPAAAARPGCLGPVRRLRPLPSWGTRSIWDAPEPAEHSHLASGYGSGWHVDRRAFDRMLAHAAADAGATCGPARRVTSCRYDGAAWEVRLRRRAASCGGRLLVDATGRRAALGRSLGARRLAFDRLVAIAAGWAGVDVADEHYLLVEAAADGWWYTAPLPGDRMVGMLMTDADLCRRDGLAGTARWHGQLRAAATTAARVAGAPPRRAAGALRRESPPARGPR